MPAHVYTQGSGRAAPVQLHHVDTADAGPQVFLVTSNI